MSPVFVPFRICQVDLQGTMACDRLHSLGSHMDKYFGDRPVQPCGFRLVEFSTLGFDHFVASMIAKVDIWWS
jgi:hypothetical protein